mmetsp:Transcript_19847/g.27705  ORF Transcript_19847/g.27705 Transcript_19847/m.27705 type:complete len:122 (+) Transcript_19847:56-421(+)
MKTVRSWVRLGATAPRRMHYWCGELKGFRHPQEARLSTFSISPSTFQGDVACNLNSDLLMSARHHLQQIIAGVQRLKIPENPESAPDGILFAKSVLKKRRTKMNKHKHRKRMKKLKTRLKS